METYFLEWVFRILLQEAFILDKMWFYDLFLINNMILLTFEVGLGMLHNAIRKETGVIIIAHDHALVIKTFPHSQPQPVNPVYIILHSF